MLREKHGEKGFTLMELMVVVIVLSILPVMIIPEFRGTYKDTLLRAAARDLLGVLNLAYSQAVTVGRVHRLRIDTDSHRFWLEKQDDKGSFVRVSDVSGSSGTIEESLVARVREPGETFEDQPTAFAVMPGRTAREPDVIYFRPDGTADAREILLRDDEGFGLTLRVNSITSRVTVSGVERMVSR